MTIAYFIRLESLIEKWQSRRKTIEISTTHSQQQRQQLEAHQDTASKRRIDASKEAADSSTSSSSSNETTPTTTTLNEQQDESQRAPKVSKRVAECTSYAASVASGSSGAPLAYKLINNNNNNSSSSSCSNSGKTRVSTTGCAARGAPVVGFCSKVALTSNARYSIIVTANAGAKKEPKLFVSSNKRYCNSSSIAAAISRSNTNFLLRIRQPSTTLASCPALLYVSLLFLCSLLLFQLAFYNGHVMVEAAIARTSSARELSSSSFTQPLPLPLLSRQLQSNAVPPMLAALTTTNVLNLIHQLAGYSNLPATLAAQRSNHRNRWTRVATRPSSLQTSNTMTSLLRLQQPLRPFQQQQQQQQHRRPWLSRIRNRIGARNTIRVHNAFRDLLWRLLSNLSMPTPVIYELRRQHLYPVEDDLKNDSLFDQNTAQTIRSKRLLRSPLKHPLSQSSSSFQAPAQRAANDDESDDDEPQSLRERAQSRLEQLVRLSRRRLFGRVIRVPAIFPFKRQEIDDSPVALPAVKSNTTAAKSTTTTTTTTSTTVAPANSRRRRLLGRRKKKEIDRQMIFINGKQYYVDDDGELKEVKDTSESSS